MSLAFRLFPYAAAFVILLGLIGLIYHHGYEECENARAVAAAKSNEVKNEIRNQPHSVELTSKRMLAGKF